MEWVIEANSLCAEVLRPDISVFLDLTPELCLERLNRERLHLELYENLETMEKVRECYMRAFELLGEKERVVVLDGSKDAKALSVDVWRSLKQLLEEPANARP